MDAWQILVLILAAVATSAVSGLVGMAGGILLLGVMTLFLPYTTLIPVHGVVQLCSNGYRAFLLRKNVLKKPLMYFLLGIPLGGYAGYLLLSSISHPEYFLILIIALLLYIVFKPKRLPELRISDPAFFLLGVAGGTLSCLVGAIGPFLAPFFIRKDYSKENIVATKASFQIAGHFIKIPTFLALSFDYGKHSLLLTGMVAGVFLGTQLGTRILKKISGEKFLLYVKIAMAFMAARLAYKLWAGA